MSKGIGEVYPGWQSGSATLVAGVKTVTFVKEFAYTPSVMVTPITTGTTLVLIQPSTIGTAGFSVTTQELALTATVTGGTLATTVISGTTAVSDFKWVAYMERPK